MRSTITLAVGCLVLCASVPSQEQPRQLKAGGHLLGETVEQFFSEAHAGDVLRACQARDWKSVSQLSKNVDHSSKNNAKDICAIQEAAKQQAATGARLEYKGTGDMDTRRADTFTFDGHHLVRINMVYSVPIADIQGYHPKSFEELFAGLQEAYGTPTKTYTEPVLNDYGVRRDARRAIWVGDKDVISIIEKPGAEGWTEIIAVTLEEYNRASQAPKTANPLQ
jgi:hypothetical protein